ncbi:GNAT family N-acetyltransferase [Salinithrix halophila]|uniref:GNAT family N-acetyltransferase n=1 Tax=Salinithrix halophila TaxID=1485204 RepID=A0ABV8JG25_9BACL
MFAHVIDDRVCLQLLEHRHAEELYGLTEANRAHLTPWFPWVETIRCSADSRTFIDGALKGFAEGKGVHCGIRLDRKLAGVVGSHTIDPVEGSAELGWWLGAPYQGRGIMTRACVALIGYLVEQRSLHRIEARCAAGNQRSQAVMESLGMRHEGTLKEGSRIGDTFDDTLIYGLLASEWKKQRCS